MAAWPWIGSDTIAASANAKPTRLLRIAFPSNVWCPLALTTMRNFGIPKARATHDILAVPLKVVAAARFEFQTACRGGGIRGQSFEASIRKGERC
jgi:hypothetical protein